MASCHMFKYKSSFSPEELEALCGWREREIYISNSLPDFLDFFVDYCFSIWLFGLYFGLLGLLVLKSHIICIQSISCVITRFIWLHFMLVDYLQYIELQVFYAIILIIWIICIVWIICWFKNVQLYVFYGNDCKQLNHTTFLQRYISLYTELPWYDEGRYCNIPVHRFARSVKLTVCWFLPS